MTDEQIVKALECCSELKRFCDECTYNNKTVEYCDTDLCKDAVALINRQKAEILAKTEEYNDMLDQRNKLEEALELKIMDVISLTSARDALLEMVKEQKAEIERLEKKIKAIRDINKRNDEHLHIRLVERAKADAIKEFAERLKSKLIIYTYLNINGVIDNLVKEMTEQKE